MEGLDNYRKSNKWGVGIMEGVGSGVGKVQILNEGGHIIS